MVYAQQGKKKIKAVSRALRNVQQTPQLGGRRSPRDLTPMPGRLTFTNYDFAPRNGPASNKDPLPYVEPPGQSSRPDALQSVTSRFAETPSKTTSQFDGNAEGTGPGQDSGQDASRRQSRASPTGSPRSLSPNSTPIDEPRPLQSDVRPEVPRIQSRTTFAISAPIGIPETQPLTGSYDRSGVYKSAIPRYGSIIGSPPKRQDTAGMSSLKLPDPAMSNPDKRSRKLQGSWSISAPRTLALAQTPSNSADAYHVGETHVPRKTLDMGLPKHVFQPKRAFSTPGGNANTSRPLVRRLFSTTTMDSPPTSDMQLNAYRELDAKQEEFFAFLAKELGEEESFYRTKEEEAPHRLHILRDQLHEMRDR